MEFETTPNIMRSLRAGDAATVTDIVGRDGPRRDQVIDATSPDVATQVVRSLGSLVARMLLVASGGHVATVRAQ